MDNDNRIVDAERLQLLRDIELAGAQLREIVGRIESHIEEQHIHARNTEAHDEMARLESANPFRWIEDAERNLQAGIMFARRAVAQPAQF